MKQDGGSGEYRDNSWFTFVIAVNRPNYTKPAE